MSRTFRSTLMYQALREVERRAEAKRETARVLVSFGNLRRQGVLNE